MVAVGQTVDDGAHVGDEAHVKHAVGLVDHQGVHLAQVHHARTQVVLQAAGRGHEQVHGGLFELAALTLMVHAAVNRQGANVAAVLAEGLGVLADLDDQLAGGCEDEGARAAGLEVALLGGAQVTREHGDQEGRRLAGAGLRLAGHVLAGEGELQRLRLDGRAVLEAQIRHRVENLTGQTKVHETLLAFGRGHIVARGVPGRVGGGIFLELRLGEGAARTHLAGGRVAVAAIPAVARATVTAVVTTVTAIAAPTVATALGAAFAGRTVLDGGVGALGPRGAVTLGAGLGGTGTRLRTARGVLGLLPLGAGLAIAVAPAATAALTAGLSVAGPLAFGGGIAPGRGCVLRRLAAQAKG